jgi:hypothetical protein
MIREFSGHFSISGEESERLAIAALRFLAGRPEDLDRFLGLTGLGPQNLRRAAADPGFLASVLDYFVADEPLMLAFAAEQGIAPQAVPGAAERLRRGEGASSE